jgi:hypothetical protein
MGPARSSRHARGHRTLEERAAFPSVISRSRRVNPTFLWCLVSRATISLLAVACAIKLNGTTRLVGPPPSPRQTADAATAP